MSDDYALPVYLIRHGQVQKQAGHLPAYDAPLRKEQPALRGLKDVLDTQIGDSDWYVSPLLRAKQTYEILAPKTASATIDARLEEQNFGNWHEMKLDEVWGEITNLTKKRHPTSFVTPDTMPPDGTSFEMIYHAAGLFLNQLISQRPRRPQIIISHYGMTSALIGNMMGLGPADAMMLTFDHGSVSRADYIWDNEMPNMQLSWQIHYLNRLYG